MTAKGFEWLRDRTGEEEDKYLVELYLERGSSVIGLEETGGSQMDSL